MSLEETSFLDVSHTGPTGRCNLYPLIPRAAPRLPWAIFDLSFRESDLSIIRLWFGSAGGRLIRFEEKENSAAVEAAAEFLIASY
jgi:hypothetical protein